eukprot:5714739-Prymnesium_polylepis.1
MIGDVATTAAPLPSRKMAPASNCSTSSGALAQIGRGTAGAGAARSAASRWPAAYSTPAPPRERPKETCRSQRQPPSWAREGREDGLRCGVVRQNE